MKRVKKEKIPGGKLLAQYCCKVMIAHWQSIHEGPKQKLEEQLKMLHDNNYVLKDGYWFCGCCGVVKQKPDLILDDCEHHYSCSSCAIQEDDKIICPQCAENCEYQTNGRICLVLTEITRTCSACECLLCPEHRQFCPDCGKLLCYQKECFTSHFCTQGKKRAKK